MIAFKIVYHINSKFFETFFSNELEIERSERINMIQNGVKLECFGYCNADRKKAIIKKSIDMMKIHFENTLKFFDIESENLISNYSK